MIHFISLTLALLPSTITPAKSPVPEDLIVFVSLRDQIEEIYSMNGDGTEQARLTHNDIKEISPALSPDDSKIVFSGNLFNTSNYQIMIMDADGGNLKRLTQNDAHDYKPTFNRDGSKIAFASSRDGNFEIYVMNVDGSGQRRVTNHPAEDLAPVFSPDGTKIAFQSNRDGNKEIYSVNLDGSGTARLTSNPLSDMAPNYSPDGSKIAFWAKRDGNYDIFTMNTDGSGARRLTTHTAGDAAPSFSADGSKITFVSDRDGNDEVYIMNADGTGQRTLSNSGRKDHMPSMGVRAPAPTPAAGAVVTYKIGFQSDRDGNEEIYVMNANGSGQTRLTTNKSSDTWPSFRKDGSKIAFASDRDGNEEIYVMNTDGTQQVRVTNHPGRDSMPAFSPDGKRIAFISNRSGKNKLHVMNADGSGVREVKISFGDGDFDFRAPAFHPNGSTIAVMQELPVGTGGSDRPGSRVCLYDATGLQFGGKSYASSVVIGGPALLDHPAFSPDGTKVVTTGIHGNLTVFDATKAGLFPEISGYGAKAAMPVYSPDGTAVLHVYGGSESDRNIGSRPVDGSSSRPLTGRFGRNIRPTVGG